MLIEDDFLFLVAHPRFYESLDHYRADPRDFAQYMARMAPAGWSSTRWSVWIDYKPPESTLPAQGFKIHLSATVGNSAAVLATAARLFFAAAVPFKFIADKTLLYLVNSKRWHRGGAGKFIAAYPEGDEQCGILLGQLYEATLGYSGPYILSDRRYRDSSIVHYRYGGFRSRKRLDVDGKGVHVLEAPHGQFVDDKRTPFFSLPPGIQDPFAAPVMEPEPEEAGTLKKGRYAIERVIGFSNTGGVYAALDRHTGQEVIIKEARPFTNVSPRGTDAVWLLKKEHRLLTHLEAAGIAPRPLDFFRDWEHYFLVEEYIQGKLLRSYHAEISLTLQTSPDAADREEFIGRFRALYLALTRAILKLHGLGVVFSDLSHYNVIVVGDGAEVRLIDFEGAYETGIDPPSLLFTPGFAPLQMLEEGMARPEDDYYSLGCLMLASLMPVNSLLSLDASAYNGFLDAIEWDFRFPAELSSCIRGLLSPERSLRPKPSEVLEVLARNSHPPETPAIGSREADAEDWEGLVGRMLDFIRSTADSQREDRLFPAAPALFDTNPLSVAYGACGVAYAMTRITGDVPPEILEWILRHRMTPEAYTPGLYSGLSGIAWSLLEMGLPEEGERVLGMTDGHPLLRTATDLFNGLAGWGMAQLRFFLATQNELYLSGARRAGDLLLEMRQEDGDVCWWSSGDAISCGLGHGVSGVSLFLLYLYLATREDRFLQVGRRGLSFVLAKAIQTGDGGWSWRAIEGRPTFTPYWRWGSSGIGMVVLRYLQIVDEPAYREALDKLLVDTDRKYTIFPGRFFGLAGIGDFYLDLAVWGQDRERALAGARKALSGLLLFKLDEVTGVAFPGESKSRISCDFGTGSAGIALFVHRLCTQSKPCFMLDELLDP